MSYEKQNFVDGQVLTAEHLNHIEAGIIAVEEHLVENPDVDLTGVVRSVNGQTPDENGNVEITIPESSGGGLTAEQITALDSMFKICAYTVDASDAYNAFKTAFGIEDAHEHSYTSTVTTAATCTTDGVRTYTCSCGDSYTEAIPATGHNYVDGVCTVCGATDPTYNPEVTLSSISAVYSGGDVAVGTAVSDLTGIVVTAHYSDGTSEAVTGYTLSGTIAEGSNTITVSYGGMTATFTVTGVAEPGGDEYENILASTTWEIGNLGAYGAGKLNNYGASDWSFSGLIPLNGASKIVFTGSSAKLTQAKCFFAAAAADTTLSATVNKDTVTNNYFQEGNDSYPTPLEVAIPIDANYVIINLDKPDYAAAGVVAVLV